MPGRVLVDTNVVIGFLAGDEQVVRHLADMLGARRCSTTRDLVILVRGSGRATVTASRWSRGSS